MIKTFELTRSCGIYRELYLFAYGRSAFPRADEFCPKKTQILCLVFAEEPASEQASPKPKPRSQMTDEERKLARLAKFAKKP